MIGMGSVTLAAAVPYLTPDKATRIVRKGQQYSCLDTGKYRTHNDGNG